MAAYRDGVVGQPGGGVTTDGERAYAILIAADEEVEARADGGVVYRPRPDRALRTKLLCSKNPVRVLRMAGGADATRHLRPEAGVRYEGLYVALSDLGRSSCILPCPLPHAAAH